jgi:hypothetical protein
VRGRAQQIEELLRATRMKLPGDPEASLALGPSMGLVIGFLVFALWISGAIHSWLVALPLLLAGAAISVIAWRWWRRRNTTEIVLNDSSSKPWSRADVISLVATAVAVLSLALAALQTWGRKH